MKYTNHQRQPAFTLSFSLLVALLYSLVGSASSQISGTELCACSPRVYELTFDFSLECEPINVDLESGGIADATCLVTGFDNINVTDLVPVAVSSVQLIEIGQDGGPAAVAQETGDFRDGSTVTYTSISFEGAVAPRAFQVRALGRNEAGEPLVLQWAVTYSNNCGVWPVLEINDSIGWTVFTGLAEPLALVCPAVPTLAPTFAATTLEPTDAPTTLAPTDNPTESPTDPPTQSPTESPTGSTPVPTPLTPAPTVSPTSAPTASPTDPPTANPTLPPVPGPPPPTGAPTMSPTNPPVETLTTPAPTQPPRTAAPTDEPMSFSYRYSFSFSYEFPDEIEMMSEDMEFGREDETKPPCRKRKVRRVRKVRKLMPRDLAKAKGLKKAAQAPADSKQMMQEGVAQLEDSTMNNPHMGKQRQQGSPDFGDDDDDDDYLNPDSEEGEEELVMVEEEVEEYVEVCAEDVGGSNLDTLLEVNPSSLEDEAYSQPYEFSGDSGDGGYSGDSSDSHSGGKDESKDESKDSHSNANDGIQTMLGGESSDHFDLSDYVDTSSLSHNEDTVVSNYGSSGSSDSSKGSTSKGSSGGYYGSKGSKGGKRKSKSKSKSKSRSSGKGKDDKPSSNGKGGETQKSVKNSNKGGGSSSSGKGGGSSSSSKGSSSGLYTSKGSSTGKGKSSSSGKGTNKSSTSASKKSQPSGKGMNKVSDGASKGKSGSDKISKKARSKDAMMSRLRSRTHARY